MIPSGSWIKQTQNPEMKNGHEEIFTVSKIFIDTNLFVYSIDQREPQKKEKARAILNRIIDSHQPVISTQVIKEFYVVATTKLKAQSLIIAAAEKANCEFVFSEDLNAGQTYRGVRVVDPFEKEDF